MASAGLICILEDEPTPTFVMIKRPTTYAYKDFIQNKYPWSEKRSQNEATMIKYFGLMTIPEKKLIYSMNFDCIWFHYWNVTIKMPTTIAVRTNYDAQLELFNQRFSFDSGQWLRSMIVSSGSISITSLFEFPHGQTKNGETLLDAAKREFIEETKLKNFKILDENRPIVQRFIGLDNGKEYQTTYFLAVLQGLIHDVNIADFNQRIEVDEVIPIRPEFFSKGAGMQVDLIKRAQDALQHYTY